MNSPLKNYSVICKAVSKKTIILKEHLMKILFKLLILLTAISILVSACTSAAKNGNSANGNSKLVEYSLMTAMVDGQMAFIGMGGGIEGVHNPTLSANVGDTVKITLTAGDSVEHDVAFPDFNAQSDHIAGQGKTSTFEFVADKPGTFSYNCLLPGHKEAGMAGQFIVTGEAAAAPASQSVPVSNVAMAASGPVVVSNPATKGADI